LFRLRTNLVIEQFPVLAKSPSNDRVIESSRYVESKTISRYLTQPSTAEGYTILVPVQSEQPVRSIHPSKTPRLID
jgi:N-acyl-L-homoserine lactone synthetase